jgi:NAD(P)-dependent dehydrogenase (short-subunit alcohol dehydrogenase family)
MQTSENPGGSLSGEVVMITGASRGLGRALAAAFAAAGAGVSGCGRSRAGLLETERVLRERGLAMHSATVDITDEAALAGWAEDVERVLGTPTVLINNASVLGARVPLQAHDVREWRTTLDVNLTGSFLAARAVLPAMRQARRGSIIQLSSGAAIPPRTSWGAYSVSKIAADGLALNLAEELKGSGVRVNIVDPGPMQTQMRAAAYPDEDPSTLEAPQARVGVFLWLAGPASGEVTGQRFTARDWTETNR